MYIRRQLLIASSSTPHTGEHTLVIESVNSIESTNLECVALYDNTVIQSGATWSVTLGSQYATIDNSGNVTILSGANNSQITVSCTYLGISATKSITVTYKAGSSSQTDTTTTTDPETGETTTTVTTTTTNQDGSSSEVITNYNENGDPTSGSTANTDTSGNVNTQNVTYDENGDRTVTAYTIDTSGNTDGTGEIISGDGVNTEFVPWDNSDGWEMHIRFRSNPSEQPNPPIVVDTEDTGANLHFTLVCAKSPFKPWPGFHMRWTLNKNTYNGNLVFGYGYVSSSGGSSTNKNLAKAPTSGANANMYDFTVSYDPTLKKYPSKFRCVDNFGRGSTLSFNYNFEPIEYEFTIGYNLNQQGQPYRYSNLTVYEFTINKL